MDEERARVKSFLRDHPEEAKRLQEEIAMETQIEQLKKEIEAAQTAVKSQAISYGKRIAKLEKEIDEYRVKLHLEKKYEKKPKEKEESTKEPIEEPEKTPETPKPAPRAVEPILPTTPPEKGPKPSKTPEKKLAQPAKTASLSKRAKEIAEQLHKIEDGDKKKLIMLNIIWEEQNTKPNVKVCDLGLLYELASQKGVPKNELETLLEELKDEGRVSEEHVGSLKTPTKPTEKSFFDE